MKKIALLFVALFFATAVKAQISPVTFGPKVGYQTTKLSTNRQVVKSDFKGNMAFGVFARLTIKNIVVQPELLYYKSGKVFEVNALGGFGIQTPDFNPTITVSQSNFALPVLLGYQFVDIPLLKMRAISHLEKQSIQQTCLIQKALLKQKTLLQKTYLLVQL